MLSYQPFVYHLMPMPAYQSFVYHLMPMPAYQPFVYHLMPMPAYQPFVYRQMTACLQTICLPANASIPVIWPPINAIITAIWLPCRIIFYSQLIIATLGSLNLHSPTERSMSKSFDCLFSPHRRPIKCK